MLLTPNTLCWSSQKCSCACALLFFFTRRSWQKFFAGKNVVTVQRRCSCIYTVNNKRHLELATSATGRTNGWQMWYMRTRIKLAFQLSIELSFLQIKSSLFALVRLDAQSLVSFLRSKKKGGEPDKCDAIWEVRHMSRSLPQCNFAEIRKLI